VNWLGRAQDHSSSQDGGVARDYSLITGWATSYPETTGYIAPTLIDYARTRGDSDVGERAKKMLDWLVTIQLPEGGFQGGRIDSTPVLPVTFNTGQILLGLAAGTQSFGVYRESMVRAADWLVATQDPDGCWRRHPTPFARPGGKAYETHVAWGLLEAAQLEPHRPYAEAALANVRWALTHQRENGWFELCCLTDPDRPLTHTLAYALRGVIEAYRHSGNAAFLNAAKLTADGLLSALGNEGRLPGRLSSSWKPEADWVCLTGSAQVAHCWLMLYQDTGDLRYREAGFKANEFVRRSVNVEGPPEIRGAVKGSFPVNGDYGAYEFLSWAVKFCIDSNLLESEITEKDSKDPAASARAPA